MIIILYYIFCPTLSCISQYARNTWRFQRYWRDKIDGWHKRWQAAEKVNELSRFRGRTQRPKRRSRCVSYEERLREDGLSSCKVGPYRLYTYPWLPISYKSICRGYITPFINDRRIRGPPCVFWFHFFPLGLSRRGATRGLLSCWSWNRLWDGERCPMWHKSAAACQAMHPTLKPSAPSGNKSLTILYSSKASMVLENHTFEKGPSSKTSTLRPFKKALWLEHVCFFPPIAVPKSIQLFCHGKVTARNGGLSCIHLWSFHMGNENTLICWGIILPSYVGCHQQ